MRVVLPSSRSARPGGSARWLVALAASLGLTATLAPAASALSVDAVRLAGPGVSDEDYPRDLAVGPDGKVRVLLERWTDGGQQREAVVGDSSLIGNPLQLLAPAATQGDFTLGALSNTGAVVSFRSNRRPHPKLRATIWEDGKPVGAARTISDPAHSFRGGWATSAPNGAAEVTFWQHLGSRLWEERMAIRPAGASRFLPAVAASPTNTPLRRRNTGGVTSETFWGSNGDGVVLWGVDGDGGPSVIRRILRDGTLGPAIRLPLAVDYPIDGSSAVAVGADGAIVIVERSYECGEYQFDGKDDYCAAIAQTHVITIPAGSNTPTTPVLLRKEQGRDNVVGEFFVGADVGSDGHVVVAVAGGKKRIELFEGGIDPTSLKSVASFPNPEWGGYGDFSVVNTADGGAAAFWGAETVTTARGPGGAWSAPAYVIPRTGDGYSVLEHPRLLPDGGVAAIIRRSTEDELGAGSFVVRIHR